MAKAPKEVKTSKTAKAKPVADAQPNRAAASIDDIFASSSKVKAEASTSAEGKTKTVESNGAPAEASKKKKKKKDQKDKKQSSDAAGEEKSKKKVSEVTTSKAPVEIIDPSIPKPKVVAAAVPAGTVKKSKKRDRQEEEDDAIFRDSRGDGPSEFAWPSIASNADMSRTKDRGRFLDLQGG